MSFKRVDFPNEGQPIQGENDYVKLLNNVSSNIVSETGFFIVHVFPNIVIKKDALVNVGGIFYLNDNDISIPTNLMVSNGSYYISIVPNALDEGASADVEFIQGTVQFSEKYNQYEIAGKKIFDFEILKGATAPGEDVNVFRIDDGGDYLRSYGAEFVPYGTTFEVLAAGEILTFEPGAYSFIIESGVLIETKPGFTLSWVPCSLLSGSTPVFFSSGVGSLRIRAVTGGLTTIITKWRM